MLLSVLTSLSCNVIMMTIMFDIMLCLDSVINCADERANVAFSANVGHSFIYSM